MFYKKTVGSLQAFFSVVTLLVIVVLPVLAAPVSLPPNWKGTGDFTADGTWQIANDGAILSGDLAPQSVVDLNLRLGLNKPATLSIGGANDKPMILTLEAKDSSLKSGGKTVPLPDAIIAISLKAPTGDVLFKNDYFVRPDPIAYRNNDESAALIARWNTLPTASQHDLQIKVTSFAGEAGIWVDDRFVGKASLPTPAKLNLELSAGNALGAIQSQPSTVDRARFVPIGLHGYQTSEQDNATLPIKRGAIQLIDNVPFAVATSGNVVDVGTSRWLEKDANMRFIDHQYTRRSFERNPGNILMAVPTDDYSWAHLLVAIDPDVKKVPVLTLSLTRYLHDSGDSGGRGDGVAYSSIRLERTDGKWPEHVRQLGTVQMKNASGKEEEMPLLQVTIPIHSGEIPDVIDETGMLKGNRSTQHLDLELTKELQLVRTANYSHFSYKPVGKPSAVLVYGLTLERSPVKVRTVARQTGNIFYSTEKTGFDLSLQNRTPQAFSGLLRWDLTDFYGKEVMGESKISIPAETTPIKLGIDLPNLGLGWYQAQLSLTDATGNNIWEQPTSLAVLAPNTRQAGLDSPYGTWWFQQSHGGTDSISEIGPLLQRMGVRHINPWKITPSGADLARYDLSLSMFPYFRGVTLQKAMSQLDSWVTQHPNVNRAMIFHESGFGAGWSFPSEFIGKGVPKLTDEQRESYDKSVTPGIAYARAIREKYPNMKLIVGNSSLPFMTGLMQNGYPKDLVDAWGDEEVGQSIIPEAPPTSSQSDIFWLDQYDKKYGYDKPVTTAFEWRGRGTNPGDLSELTQAQYYTRDVLRALAFGAKSINPGLIYDVGDAYYYTRWGAGGFLRRYPFLNPKISYIAMSVLTQQLDEAQFQRVLDTDSPTLNVLEFRQGQKWVYALWIPRGEEPVTLTFASDGTAQLPDMNGRSDKLNLQSNQATITVSGSPVYIHSVAQIIKIVSGDTNVAAPKSTFVMADPLNNLDQWKVVRADDLALDQAQFDFPRQVGNIDVKVTPDLEKKSALELTLQPQPDVPWPIARYVTLEPQQPVLLQGNPTSVGVWVKGNSSWSNIFFEVEDAKGEKFYSIGAVDGGAETNGWNLADWKGKNYIDFDGWNFISVKLPQKYDGGIDEPQQSDWRSQGGDGVIDYPVRITKVVVAMRDKVVQVNRAVDVPNRSIWLYGLGGE